MEFDPELFGYSAGALDFLLMALSVIKGHDLDFTELLQSPEQAGGTILAATEYDDGLLVLKHKKTSLLLNLVKGCVRHHLHRRKRVLELEHYEKTYRSPQKGTAKKGAERR
ncbi:hypothetical protein D3C77_515880 [compost metagenome]